jgi:hypothetical protein
MMKTTIITMMMKDTPEALREDPKGIYLKMTKRKSLSCRRTAQ